VIGLATDCTFTKATTVPQSDMSKKPLVAIEEHFTASTNIFKNPILLKKFILSLYIQGPLELLGLFRFFFVPLLSFDFIIL